MTVEELRALLADLPADMTVYGRDPHCCGQGGATENAAWPASVAMLDNGGLLVEAGGPRGVPFEWDEAWLKSHGWIEVGDREGMVKAIEAGQS